MATNQELFTTLDLRAREYAIAEARRQFWQQKHDKHMAERASLTGEAHDQANADWKATKEPLADAIFQSRHAQGEMIGAARLVAEAALSDPEAHNMLMGEQS